MQIVSFLFSFDQTIKYWKQWRTLKDKMRLDLVLCPVSMTVLVLTMGEGVKITEVSIPRTVEIGQENIILNCDYNFDQEEAQQLEIKWYFNKDPSPFFQWIAGLPDAKGFNEQLFRFSSISICCCVNTEIEIQFIAQLQFQKVIYPPPDVRKRKRLKPFPAGKRKTWPD